MSEDPKHFNNPAGHQLRPEQIDDVGRALISLTREVCVLTDRILVLEAVLDSKGLEVSEAVDTHQPNEGLKKAIGERTTGIIDDVLASLSGRDYRRG